MTPAASRPSDQAVGQHDPVLPAMVREAGLDLELSAIEDFRLDLDVAAGEEIYFAIESLSSEDVPNAALLEVRAFAPSGARMSIPKWAERSNRIAEIKHLSSAAPDEIALTVFRVAIPDESVKLELIGHRNKSRVATWVIGAPVVNREGTEAWKFVTESGARLEHSARNLRQELQIPEGATGVELSVHHVARRTPSSGPISVVVHDSEGVELLPLPELQQHPRLGSVVLLDGEPDEYRTTLVAFKVPPEAATVGVVGANWGSRTASVTGPVELRASTEVGRSIEEFIDSIPDDDSLVIVDTTAPPMGHETLGLRPNNLSNAYAKLGVWVIFLPFSSLKEFAADVSEKIYQVGRADTERLWNAVRSHRQGCNDIYICSSFPSFEANAAANEARRLGWRVVYEVRDDMEEFNRVGYSKWYTPILEQRMLRTADRVVSVSRALDEKMATMHPGLASHTVIPNGVRSSTIAAGESLRTRRAVEIRAHSSTIGYVGHLTPSWFDWPLLLRVAARAPGIRFEIVGHGMPGGLKLPDNVVYLGPKSHEELAEIVATWRAGIIPFLDIPLTRSVDPNKIYEYFAWGLRCVTIDMGAVQEYPWTHVYSDADSFLEGIRWAIDTPVNDVDLFQLTAFLESVSWDSRAKQMIDFIERGVQA